MPAGRSGGFRAGRAGQAAARTAGAPPRVNAAPPRPPAGPSRGGARRKGLARVTGQGAGSGRPLGRVVEWVMALSSGGRVGDRV